MMLDPKDARVCILDDDAPDLAGIARAGVKTSRAGRGHAKGVVGFVKTRQRLPETKLRNAARARDEAYPCKYPALVDEAARARKSNVHCFYARVPDVHALCGEIFIHWRVN